MEDFPRLNFNCILNLDDKKRLFKKLDISKKIDADILNINVEGSLNLLNQKVNFKKIQTNKGYLANKEDTQYFQDNFQKIFLDKNIFYIFNEKKIKEFLLEII